MPTVRINLPIDATEIDVPVDATEITELQVQKVSGVAAGANGTPFLLMKSSAATDWRSVPFEQWTDETIDALEADTTVTKDQEAVVKGAVSKALYPDKKAEPPVKKHTKEKAKAAALAAMKGTKPPGTVGVSDPQDGEDESAEMQRIVTKAAASDNPDIQAAVKVLLDPNSSDEAKRVAYTLLKEGNGGDVQPALPTAHDANDVNAVLQPGDLAKMRIEWERETDPVKKAELGEHLTFETLRALHHTTPSPTAMKSAVDTSTDSPEVARLRELVEDPNLDPAVKMQAGEVLTKHDLAKSAYTDSQEATNRLVAETQARVTANAKPAGGGYSGVAGDALIPTTPKEDRHATQRLAPTGKIEPEPAAVLGQLEDELAQVQKETKLGSITDREVDLRAQITRQRLAMTHV